MLQLFLYVVKRQVTICFKSSKPIQIGLCVLMSLSIHLHGLHLDAQYGQMRHLSTQLRSGERTGRRLLWSTTVLLLILLSYLHKWGLAQLPSCICGQRQTIKDIVDTWPLTKFEGGLNLLHEAVDDAVIWLESTATIVMAPGSAKTRSPAPVVTLSESRPYEYEKN